MKPGASRRATAIAPVPAPPAPAGWSDAAPPPLRAGESLGEYAYRVLRDAIRCGRLASRMHLRETEVARWLDISRTPVREAFHRIIAEGLLVAGPWNGAMVVELDRRQLVELYAVREALEGTAAALAAQHASKAEVQLLLSIAEREAGAADDPARLVVINAELHQGIYDASHNRYLLQSVNSIVDALGLLRHSTFVLPGSAAQASREHLGLIRAIRDRQARRADELARAHVRNALELRLKLPLGEEA